jgi:predicted dehydrogenase
MAEALRWGIVGTGWIASSFAKDLKLSDSGSVVAVGSRTQASADRFADAYGIPKRHDSYEALVADPEVNVVYVATPHPLHRENTLLALEAGKPVLVEKAFTMNAAEARELVAVARAKRLFLMEAMWTRFLPHVREINRLIGEGALGEVTTVMADHGQWFAQDPAHRLFAPELGGSALLDLGVYPVSFASMILGTPTTIKAVVQPAFTGVDGQVSMIFGHASGAQAVLNCNSAAKSPTWAAIVGTEARIEVKGNFYSPTRFKLISRQDKVLKRYAKRHAGHGLRHEADEVARCIGEGLLESPLMPLDETVSIMETMDAVLAQA